MFPEIANRNGVSTVVPSSKKVLEIGFWNEQPFWRVNVILPGVTSRFLTIATDCLTVNSFALVEKVGIVSAKTWVQDKIAKKLATAQLKKNLHY